ncbi:MAG: hypothetical protein HY425_02580 [Candidatus Levybacteria bacterium]|nr:hypothetical protein [Candidatus Levybacteria bacterium]
MNKPEILPYHRNLASLLKSEPNRSERIAFLKEERKTPEYQIAKEEARKRNYPDVLQVPQDSISSAIASLSAEDRELSPQEQTMLWAYKTLDEYSNLPKENHRERVKVHDLVRQTVRHLLKNPQDVDIAGSIWKSRVEQGSDPKESFYETIKQESVEQARKHWKEITSSQLAEIVKAYVHSSLASDIGESILTGYFKGPDSRNEWIDAQYAFAFAVLDLIEDQKAFNKAMRISLFDTNILSIDSNLSRRANVLVSLPYDVDDRTFQKFLVTQNVIIRSSYLASEDLTESRRRGPKALRDDPKFKQIFDITQQQAIKKLGFPKAQEINQAMVEMRPNVSGITDGNEMDTEGILRAATKWPSNLVLDQLEPLNQKFRMVGGPKEDYESTKRIAREIALERGLGEVYFLDVPTSDGFILGVAIPQALIGRRKEIIKLVLNRKFSAEEISGFDKPQHLFISHSNRAILSLQNESLIPVDRFDSQSIILTQRKPNYIESNKHPLQALEQVGFIAPRMEGADVREVNKRLADEISRSQIRFLNRRGVRVPLEKQLKEMGYTHVDFHKDANSDRLLVRVFVGDRPYTVKFDRYFNLDLEGKRLDNLALAESLRYVFLSLLRPILCEERIKDPHLPEAGAEEREIVSRMGHLRWLPQGQRFSKAAVENYLRLEQKDLYVTNLQRMEEHPNKGETTYVKPVIEKEENLPPITIHLPGVLRFN